MRDCPSLSVSARIGHISPVNKPLIRRRILLAADRLESRLPEQSPVLLLIDNACDFKFEKEEVEGLFCNGEESWAVMVWSFTVIPGAQFKGMPQQMNAVDLPGMPAIGHSSCVCCAQSRGVSIQTADLPPNPDSSESEDSEQCSGDEDVESSELFTQVLAVKGSTYEERYQTNLKTVQTALRHQKDIVVKLLPEKENPKDANAICVIARIEEQSLPLGYIGVRKIPKVTSAIRNKEIVSVYVKSVTSWFVNNLNARKLRAFVYICKKGRWLPDSDNNAYNSIL
ncbi:uncharacterized protein LOC133180449 [Saccostrea echinata]|uniref:uncharacterized protein LOC133180449 n=1 Tax=Saccostrea echinata TaxID=191078 RepID=UPI002A82840F|nr:uncharacterized protein LOC133180449 [Saccostrea echinata]